MRESRTEQEAFWAGEFGDNYTDRNQNPRILSGNVMMFSGILGRAHGVRSVIEFGANIGLNLIAIRTLVPDVELSAVELNERAVEKLRQIGGVRTYFQSIIDFAPDYERDLVLAKTVPIHINPDMLPIVYDLLYRTSRRYICIAEYYNPVPVAVDYRGHKNKLFKRDFAGELLDRYADLRLAGYGFTYHRDPQGEFDDINWFLLEK